MVEFVSEQENYYAQTLWLALCLREYIIHQLYPHDHLFIRFLLLLIEVTWIQAIREADEQYGILTG